MFAVTAGIFGVLLCYGRHLSLPGHPGDFGLSWFGARSMLAGQDPYPLVGPGLQYDWPWRLLYPGTSFVLALPFALLPLLVANLAFVFISCALLGYAVTGNGWIRAPMFGSAPFVLAAGAAQWSPLFTAALIIPFLGAAFPAKPSTGIAFAAASSAKGQKYALAGALLTFAVSLIAMPQWPREWLELLPTATHIAAPIVRLGGPAVLIALLRWRRPEARLIVLLACVPQTGSWYEALPLFLAAATYHETMLLAVLSSVGFLLHSRFYSLTEVEFNQMGGALMIAFVYLPATIMTLRRPNEGELPWWLRWVDRKSHAG
jgi:hypothetical protein